MGLALLCLGLLIFFIHHMSQSLQVAVILDEVRHELIAQIDAIYPQDIGHGVPDPPSPDGIREQLQSNGNRLVVRAQKA